MKAKLLPNVDTTFHSGTRTVVTGDSSQVYQFPRYKGCVSDCLSGLPEPFSIGLMEGEAHLLLCLGASAGGKYYNIFNYFPSELFSSFNLNSGGGFLVTFFSFKSA